MSVESLYAAIQEECLPAVWSRGVSLGRAGSGTAIVADRFGADEVIARVLVKDRPVHPKVTLWIADEDWYCDCGDRNDPCLHVAAAIIALKTGTLAKPDAAAGASPAGAAAASPAGAAASPAPVPKVTQLVYRFTRENGALRLTRALVRPGAATAEPLRESLVSVVGGISTGRVPGPAIAAAQSDFAVDRALSGLPQGELRPDAAALARLLAALEDCSRIELDGAPVTCSGKIAGWKARLVDADNGGFRMERILEPGLRESFTNGAALFDAPAGASPALALRPLREPPLSPQEREWVPPGGRIYAAAQGSELALSILPALEGRVRVEVGTDRLPRVRDIAPRAVIRVERGLGDASVAAVPLIVYGDSDAPPLATLEENRFELHSRSEIPRRDPVAERALARRIQSELHLQPGQLARFEGPAAVDFVQKLRGWETTGGGRERLRVAGTLAPRFRVGEGGEFGLEFDLESTDAGSSGRTTADLRKVFEAWRRGDEHVPLLGGGWAKLPRDWLQRFGARAQALLAARTHADDSRGGPLPGYLLPELAELAESSGAAMPDSLRRLRERLDTFAGIPPAPLPADLRADLRAYQRAGIDWLFFLRENGMGALLADDMGLGKTLQAMCAIRGRTLVVCPTSVIGSWKAQLARFRPSLRVSVYHGLERELDPVADVTLTTYGVLRLDRDELAAPEWDAAILDEAQTIKNPDSAVARAAFGLRGRFRIALTGTPIENRLDDLWSQFRFLNPGLLGERDEFRDRAATQPKLARARIKPFILRRLKREVAPELPPRTEITLHCELSAAEEELYNGLLAASRTEVLQRLDSGGGVMQALEMLLRLRQACCHPALVPGGAEIVAGAKASGDGAPGGGGTDDADSEVDVGTAARARSRHTSSKLALLMDTLDESIALGHRSLVFSQWTSLLDRIEPELRAANRPFLRLDGSTRDREAVVNAFQDPAGPPVLLISLKAGGTGLTLTAADHVFILDPWWNPAVEDQAADRAHRIGQTNPVLVHRLVARGTVEDRILELQRRKQELAASFLAGADTTVALTREDLRDLLS